MKNLFLKTINYTFIFYIISIILVNFLYNLKKQPIYYSFGIILLLITIFIIFKYPKKEFSGKILSKISFKVFLIVVFFAKISFIFFSYDNFEGDVKYTYDTVISNNFNDNISLKLFPFLMPYIYILKFIYNIIKDFHISVIFINLILDICISVLIYNILKIRFDSFISRLGVFYYIVNPFNIIFSSLGLNITLFNFCIFSVIYFTYIFFKSHSNNIRYLYALFLGVVLAMANTVRPISIIFIIAIFILLLLNIKSNKVVKTNILSFSIILIMFLSTFNLLNSCLYKSIGSKPIDNIGGWNIYVGTNYKYSGGWNKEDSEYFSSKIKNSTDYSVSLYDIREEGKNRYLNYNLKQKIVLPIKKFVKLVSFANLPYNFSVYSKVYYYFNFLNIVFFVWGILVLFASLFKIIRNIKYKVSYNVYDLFLILSFNGLVTAFLFVEVANRYFIPMLTILTLYSSDYIYLFLKYLNNKVSILFNKI